MLVAMVDGAGVRRGRRGGCRPGGPPRAAAAPVRPARVPVIVRPETWTDHPAPWSAGSAATAQAVGQAWAGRPLSPWCRATARSAMWPTASTTAPGRTRCARRPWPAAPRRSAAQDGGVVPWPGRRSARCLDWPSSFFPIGRIAVGRPMLWVMTPDARSELKIADDASLLPMLVREARVDHRVDRPAPKWVSIQVAALILVGVAAREVRIHLLGGDPVAGIARVVRQVQRVAEEPPASSSGTRPGAPRRGSDPSLREPDAGSARRGRDVTGHLHQGATGRLDRRTGIGQRDRTGVVVGDQAIRN